MITWEEPSHPCSIPSRSGVLRCSEQWPDMSPLAALSAVWGQKRLSTWHATLGFLKNSQCTHACKCSIHGYWRKTLLWNQALLPTASPNFSPHQGHLDSQKSTLGSLLLKKRCIFKCLFGTNGVPKVRLQSALGLEADVVIWTVLFGGRK